MSSDGGRGRKHPVRKKTFINSTDQLTSCLLFILLRIIDNGIVLSILKVRASKCILEIVSEISSEVFSGMFLNTIALTIKIKNTHTQKKRERDRETETETDRQTDRQTDRHIEKGGMCVCVFAHSHKNSPSLPGE